VFLPNSGVFFSEMADKPAQDLATLMPLPVVVWGVGGESTVECEHNPICSCLGG
jgi:hypothetical protein